MIFLVAYVIPTAKRLQGLFAAPPVCTHPQSLTPMGLLQPYLYPSGGLLLVENQARCMVVRTLFSFLSGNGSGPKWWHVRNYRVYRAWFMLVPPSLIDLGKHRGYRCAINLFIFGQP